MNNSVPNFNNINPEFHSGCTLIDTAYRIVRINCNNSSALVSVDYNNCMINSMLSENDAKELFRKMVSDLTNQMAQHGYSSLYSNNFISDTKAIITRTRSEIARLLMFPLKVFRTPADTTVYRYRDITIKAMNQPLFDDSALQKRFFAFTDQNTIYNIGSSMAECLFLIDCKKLDEEQSARNCVSNFDYETLSITTTAGTLVASISNDEDEDGEFPGICVDLNPKPGTESQVNAGPTVYIECPLNYEPVVRIWQADAMDEKDMIEIPLMRKSPKFEQTYVDLLSKLQNDVESDIMPDNEKSDILQKINQLQTMLERYSG